MGSARARWLEGQRNLERRALPRRTVDRDVAAVRPSDVLHQCQADARPANRLEPHRTRSIEPLEDALVLLGIDPLSPVADGQEDPFGAVLAVLLEAQLDLLA